MTLTKEYKAGFSVSGEMLNADLYVKEGFGVAKEPGSFWVTNPGDSVNVNSQFASAEEALRKIELAAQNYGYNNSKPQQQTQWVGLSEQIMRQNKEMAEKAARTQQLNPTKTMTRLTSYNDWTILLGENKLVAVNSNNVTIRAVGSLLSAGGKAWMWKDGQLWSGELERTITELEEKQEERKKKKNAIYEKYAKKIDKAITESNKLMQKRDEELYNA